MVLLTTTPTILHAISLLPPSTTTPTLETTTLPTSTTDPIPHTTLIALARALRSPSTASSNSPTYTLSHLLHKTKPYIPPPPPPLAKSPSYTALRARLLADAETQQYNTFISPSARIPLSLSPFEDDTEDDISPSLVFNILLSVVLCAFAIWWATRFFSDDGLRVLASLLGAVVVGVAETGVYAFYLQKVKAARKREGNLKERKVVMGDVGGETRTDAGSPRQNLGMEKEEIWGKGINGGMRRRVREKWERETKSSEL